MQVQFIASRRRSRRGLWTGLAVALTTAGLVAGGVAAGVLSPANDAAVGEEVVPALPEAPPPVAASPTPEPIPPPPPVPVTRDALVADLYGLLVAPGVEGTLAVAIVDEHGRVLVDRGADSPLLPASTQKLVTAAAALRTFGADHRFRTELRATVIPADGVLAGDLVLVGAGDPALATPLYGEKVYPARPRTPIEVLADAVVNAGIARIDGSVIGDASAYGVSPQAEGWFPRYFWDLDARYVSSLTVEAGLRVTYDEPADDLTVELADDPTANAAQVLHDLLVQRGVEIVGTPRGQDTPVRAPVRIGHVESPPLARMLEHTVRRSDNHMADSLLFAVTHARTGAATWTAGEHAVREALADIELDWTGATLADGSGLSRANRLSARFLTDLDAAMYRSEDADTWHGLMAVAGQEGTLRRRLVGTPADARFTGKTGTLDDVRAVTGAVHGPEGRRYHVTVVGNDLAAWESRANIRTLMDNLALVLAADLHGCTETTTPYDPAVHAEPPPRSWACP